MGKTRHTKIEGQHCICAGRCDVHKLVAILKQQAGVWVPGQQPTEWQRPLLLSLSQAEGPAPSAKPWQDATPPKYRNSLYTYIVLFFGIADVALVLMHMLAKQIWPSGRTEISILVVYPYFTAYMSQNVPDAMLQALPLDGNFYRQSWHVFHASITAA